MKLYIHKENGEDRQSRTRPAMFAWETWVEPLAWPVLPYIRWKTAVAFVKDTTLTGIHQAAQIIKNPWKSQNH